MVLKTSQDRKKSMIHIKGITGTVDNDIKTKVRSKHKKSQVIGTEKSEDMKIRLMLAKMIGLNKIPKTDPKAFDQLYGLLKDEFSSEDFDPVKLVREVRGG